MLRIFFDFRRVSTLIAPVLIIALAALMFASAPAATQTAPADATATPTATGTATATPTATPTATATATATPTATPTVPPANADHDVDNDGLIEIRTLAQLNAVRHDLNGDGKQGSVSAADWTTYTTAFLNAASDMGCKLTDHDSDAATPQQATCTGYELMMDLDFDTNSDGRVDATDANSYANWTPIGTAASPFNATFKGSLTNGVMPKISNLTISGASTEAGLFGATGSNAHIESVGLADANVSITTTAAARIGALAGSNSGKVIACYSTGAITASAGAASYAGGLIGHQATNATTAASFSRATVSMSIDPAVTDAARMYIYAGGLMGHNSGTITAAYAAGAVKGKGGSSSFIGGLVGDNNGTMTASYSIAPVTAAAGSVITPGGLVGYNDRTNGRITASYWDYLASGIDDDSDNGAMPEGKSTRDLMSPRSPSGIYADWDDLTIDTDGANNDDPWAFDDARFHPLLTYGGHTTTQSGNQLFVSSGISSGYSGGLTTGQPREGMTLKTSLGSYKGMGAFKRPPSSVPGRAWIWESSTDGIAWTTLSDSFIPPSLRGGWAPYQFVLRPEHVGKYFRVRVLLSAGGYAYTRVIGKIRTATEATAAPGFAGGNSPPRIGSAITIASLPSGIVGSAVGSWYRCDTNGDNPTGCEFVGSLTAYTPGGGDLDHYLRPYIYYNKAGVWTRATTGFTQKVTEVQRAWPWRQ